jgi:hypothetical protein
VSRTQWDETEVAAARGEADRQVGPKRGPVVTRVLPTVDDDPDDLAEREIEYDATSPDSFVISGPLPHGGGPGRAFQTVGEARVWAKAKYGAVLERLRDAEWGGRWALRVPKPKQPEPPDYRVHEEVL